MAAQKCSDRRIILRRVQGLVNEMILINEAASRLAAIALKSGLTDEPQKVEPLLAGCGPATGIVGTTDTISDLIVGILHDELVDDEVGAKLSWTYTKET